MIFDMLVVIVGVLLPAYGTYKSLRQKASTNRLIWLRYWVVFGFYHSIISIADILIFWLPLYSTGKVLVLLWLSSSKASGAQIVYNFAILPLLKDREAVIDKKIEGTKKQIAIYFWRVVTSTGINWSLVIATALKSGVGMAIPSQESVCSNQQNVPQIQADAVDGILSEEEDMVTDDETLENSNPLVAKVQHTQMPLKNVNGRGTRPRSRRVKAEDE